MSSTWRFSVPRKCLNISTQKPPRTPRQTLPLPSAALKPPRPRHASTQTSSLSTTPPRPPPPLLSTKQPPYHVSRTPFNQLPVYHLAKRGGNLHQTRIRRIQGDITALREDLIRALDLKPERAVIKQLTGHIIIKGWFRKEITRFLEERKF